MARAFYAGPHGDPSLAGSLPGCLACHTTHGTARIPPDQVDELCATCHDVDGRVPGLAGEIEEQILRARQDLAAAAHAIEEMEATGRSVADERFRYLAAYTAYKQFGRVQHSLDLAQLEELGRQVRSNTGVINATAEAYAEERWEHKLLLIPVWFLALSALVLAMFKLRDLEH
jgi:cytochrome c553